MEESVVLVSLCCFFSHICSRSSLLLSTDRVPRQTETALLSYRAVFSCTTSKCFALGGAANVAAHALELDTQLLLGQAVHSPQAVEIIAHISVPPNFLLHRLTAHARGH